MSKALDKYFIQRLEKIERDLKYEERRSECILEDLRKAKEKLNTLANLFEQEKSGDCEYYRLKEVVFKRDEAYEIIYDLLNPELEMPF